MVVGYLYPERPWRWKVGSWMRLACLDTRILQHFLFYPRSTIVNPAQT
jgi:hypothetical protein